MGSTSIEAPSAPSTTSSVQDWAANLPAVYDAQLKYAPQQAQQQLALTQQYATPMAQALQDAQSALYPQTTALQENLAGQATAGMTQDVPQWMQDAYRSNVNAQLGNNAASPIGADYMSRGLLQQQQDWKQYYQNMGLSLTGRQPLTQASTPATTDYMSGFTPGSVMSSNNQNYGTAANIYSTQQQAATAQNAAMMNLIGSGIGAAGSVGGSMFGLGGTFGKALPSSSMRYKNRIKKWA
jgi:hypothetical protein